MSNNGTNGHTNGHANGQVTGLEINRLTKIFNTDRLSVTALENVDLNIGKGQFVSIVGTSGCGKTTLLRIMAGLEGDFDGGIELEGKAIKGPGRDKGVVFQEHRLLPWLTIEENVGFGLIDRPADESRELIDRYLKLVGLVKFAKAYPGQLSGGMAQRAAIARALVNKPKILLLDEPLGALDAMTRMYMQNELEKIWLEEKITMVMVTHDVEEAIYLSDVVVLMSSRPGRVKKVIPVSLARSRHRDNPEFVAIKRDLLEEFHLQAKDYFSFEI
jgi:ABC-type nitrate/sulfonate/bicarbonate transport system ATPase subunit